MPDWTILKFEPAEDGGSRLVSTPEIGAEYGYGVYADFPPDDYYMIPVSKVLRTAIESKPGDGRIALGHQIPGPLDGSIVEVLVVEKESGTVCNHNFQTFGPNEAIEGTIDVCIRCGKLLGGC